MAKNLKFVRTVTDKVDIKGTLSEDAVTITYVEDKETKEANISEYLKKFAGIAINLSISTKTENDLIESNE